MGVLNDLGTPCPLRPAGEADRVADVPAQVVAAPTSTAEVAALLRACHARGLAVTVRGAGTKLHWGGPPRRLDVLLDTTALDALVEHAHGDLVATTGAGMRLAALDTALAEHGQQLVLDDLAGGSTIGGALATGMCGPRRMAVGAPRDLLIGVRLVRADGVAAKAGGKVVKNVAGYDLGKLLVGSYGTLAVITEATFRLHPRPAASRWVHASTPVPHIPDLLTALRSTQLVPSALEIDHDGPTNAPARVAVLITGTGGGVDSRAAALYELLPGADTVEHLDWPFRYPWTEHRAGTRPERSVGVRLTGRLSAVPDLVRHAIAEGAHVRGSAGVGVLYADLSRADDAAASVGRLRDAAQQAGGSLVVLHASPDQTRSLDVWGPVGGLDLMRRVKQEFDPAGVLSPGRFVGGI